MYQRETPPPAELPSSKQLLRSTLLAALAAGILLLAIVLPAEYGIDPTGVGRFVGLTEMGEVKQRLAAEAAADAAAPPSAATPTPTPSSAIVSPEVPAGTASAPALATALAGVSNQAAQSSIEPVAWRDQMSVTLQPGEGTEIKLTMAAGAKADYSWVVEGGKVNFDTHGDGSGRSISYEKGRSVSADDGVLQAAFSGNHGWYWRNRGKSAVTVNLRTRGAYTDIKKRL